MKVDIQHQWRSLANWYWDSVEGKSTYSKGWSIWGMLEHEYGAVRRFDINNLKGDPSMWVEFPDEKMYTAFLLRWA